jgi:UDP-glucose 4-epimerase
MARVLVTGGNGFLGHEIVRALAARGDTVIAFDMVIGARLAALAEQYDSVTTVAGQITEWPSVAAVIQAEKPDAVVHCAAIVGVPASVEAPYATLRVNVEGSLSLLQAMRLLGVRRMVHISTEEVYGDFQAEIIDETHPCFPVMPYGISKFAFEQLSRSFAQQFGVEVIHVRTCWVYGAGLPRARVPKTLVDAAVEGRPLHLPAGGDFRVDHVYYPDTVQGVLLALDKAEHRFDVYNVATGEAPSLAEIVAIIQDAVPEADISVGQGHYPHTAGVIATRKGALDISRAKAELGYAPRYDIRAGLIANIEALRAGEGRTDG